MKTIVVALAALLVGCSSDSGEADCTCKMAKFRLTNNEGFFYVPNMPMDCETGQPLYLIQDNAVYVNCE